MTLFHAVSAGFLVGLSVVVPVGPISLLCAQRTLAFGAKIGISTGLGAATVTVTYACLIVAGLDAAGPWLASSQHVLNTAGGLVLIGMATRTLLRERAAPSRLVRGAPSPARAYLSAMLVNLVNPLGPLLMLAALASADLTHAGSVGLEAASLLGLLCAAVVWWVGFNGAIGAMRTRATPDVLRWLNVLASLLLSLYGALTLARALNP